MLVRGLIGWFVCRFADHTADRGEPEAEGVPEQAAGDLDRTDHQAGGGERAAQAQNCQLGN